VFCEPASAASVAGVRRLAAEGRIDPGATIVCVLTGHGLKDPDTAARQAAAVAEADPTVAGVREALGW
jgi:threonine synthase